MEKTIARIFSILFHPFSMTSLGMLLLFNSGTSLAVIQTEVKNLSLIVTVLFTIVFPALMILLLYATRVIDNIELNKRRDRVLPMSLVIIMYMFTFFVMRGIPQLTKGHIVFLLCPPAALFIALILNNFMKPSIHMLGIGMLLGIMLVLILFYGAQIQFIFMTTILVSGVLGTARLSLGLHTPLEIFAGFITGFLVSGMLMTIYIIG